MPPRNLIAASLCLMLSSGCSHAPRADHARVAPGTRLEDIRFHSDLLSRDVTYRVIAPTHPATLIMPVVYLLHGAGDDYTSWTDNTSIADFAEKNSVILIMPDALGSLLVNTSSGTKYEDYLLQELIPDFHRHYPQAATDRQHTAIAGISRGGFSAINLALRHPNLFSYAAGISPAIDLAERPFSWRRFGFSMQLRAAFGASDSEHRKQNDPFLLLKSYPPLPFSVYVACGNSDVLAASAHRFVDAAVSQGMATMPAFADGAHDWSFWNAALPDFEANLANHLELSSEIAPALNNRATP